MLPRFTWAINSPRAKVPSRKALRQSATIWAVPFQLLPQLMRGAPLFHHDDCSQRARRVDLSHQWAGNRRILPNIDAFRRHSTGTAKSSAGKANDQSAGATVSDEKGSNSRSAALGSQGQRQHAQSQCRYLTVRSEFPESFPQFAEPRFGSFAVNDRFPCKGWMENDTPQPESLTGYLR